MVMTIRGVVIHHSQREWVKIGVCDGRSSFYSKYDDDDDGRRHQNKNVALLMI